MRNMQGSQIKSSWNNPQEPQQWPSCRQLHTAGLSETPSSRPGPGPPALAAAPEDGAPAVRPGSTRCGAGGLRAQAPAVRPGSTRCGAGGRRRGAQAPAVRPGDPPPAGRSRAGQCLTRGAARRPMSDSASDKFPSATQLRWTGQDGSTRCGDRSAQPRSARHALRAQLMSAQGRRTSYGSSC